jgi:hypothetical protein
MDNWTEHQRGWRRERAHFDLACCARPAQQQGQTHRATSATGVVLIVGPDPRILTACDGDHKLVVPREDRMVIVSTAGRILVVEP